MAQETLQFSRGMDRRADASPDAPYELHNARVEPYGTVRAYKEPQEMEDPNQSQLPYVPDRPGGAKPWKRWNGHWLSRYNELGTNPVLRWNDYEEYNGYLYGTHNSGVSDNIPPKLFAYGPDYDPQYDPTEQNPSTDPEPYRSPFPGWVAAPPDTSNSFDVWLRGFDAETGDLVHSINFTIDPSRTDPVIGLEGAYDVDFRNPNGTYTGTPNANVTRMRVYFEKYIGGIILPGNRWTGEDEFILNLNVDNRPQVRTETAPAFLFQDDQMKFQIWFEDLGLSEPPDSPSDTNRISYGPASIFSAECIFDQPGLYYDSDGNQITRNSPRNLAVGGVSPGYGVQYIFVPVNERGEAGPPVYFSHVANFDPDDNVFAGSAHLLRHRLIASSHTSYVDVYRTREFPTIDDVLDPTFYYHSRVDVNGAVATVVDAKTWPYTPATDEEGESVVPSKTYDRKINAWDVADVVYSGSSDDVDVVRHVYRSGSSGSSLKSPGANTMMMDGSERMIYGNVTYPAKRPQVMFQSNIYSSVALNLEGVSRTPVDSDDPSGETITYNVRSGTPPTYTLMYEYRTSQGKVYGPATTVEAYLFRVAWQGEQALLVFRDGELWARMVPGARGFYDWNGTDLTVGQGTDPNYEPPGTPFSSYQNQQKEYITEPNVGFLSERFRPFEMLLEDQFQVPSDHTILDISPARQAEEESIATYTFYVLTDKAVYAANRDDTLVALQTFPVGTGVKTFTVESTSGERPEYSYPLVTQTKFGVAFVGQDSRVYHLVGRQHKILDAAVPNIWWSDLSQPAFADENFRPIYIEYSDVWAQVTADNPTSEVEFPTLTPFDLAYDTHRDEIVLITKDNLWIYSFEQQGWVGNYNITNALSAQYLDDNRAVMVHVNDVGADNYLLLNERGPFVQDASVLTNQVLRVPVSTMLRELRIDYDPASKTGTAPITDGATEITLSSTEFDFETPTGSRADQQGDAGATIFIEGAAGDTRDNYSSFVAAVTDPNTAQLADAVQKGSDFSGVTDHRLRWFPPMIVRQEVTGDHYYLYVRDGVSEDPIRRTEMVYRTYPRQRRFPKRTGTGHIFKFERFRSFKSALLITDPQPGIDS